MAKISPTVHKVLEHAPQVINEYNDGFGLENLSEEGIEASNKLIRRYRERLTRKFCFEEESNSIFIRFLSQSDPIIGSYRKGGDKRQLVEATVDAGYKNTIGSRKYVLITGIHCSSTHKEHDCT